MSVEAELARSKLTVRELLALDVGSVIPTSRPAGESLDIVVGGTAVGSGEVIVLGSTVGLRVTNIKTKKQR